MSYPQKKAAQTEAVAAAAPTGRVPSAEVSARHEGEVLTRKGRGFSWGEVSGAGVDARHALDWGLMIDRRRRSVLQSNVEVLKGWAPAAKTTPKKEKKVEKVEEELAKVEKEVKKEATALKKDAKKVEKKAAKVAKEMKEEVEKPVKKKEKAKPSKKK